jgi:hypothetical protein
VSWQAWRSFVGEDSSTYVYADDVAPLLPKGTILKVTAWHNTSAKKSNPDPNQWVGWGDRTVDERRTRGSTSST